MSIQVYDVQIKDKNNQLKSEGAILLEYFNKLVRECRKETKGKSYDELENGESIYRFQNRMGYFEDKVNNQISEMITEITFKAHKEALAELKDENCLYSWDYTDSPIDDLNTYANCLRKKVKAVIKIYEQHEFRGLELIRGYSYHKSY